MDSHVSCSARALLDTWSSHSWTGGVQLETMRDMDALSVDTENSTYEITVISGRTGDILIRGGRFFPEFTPAKLAGSSLGGSFLKLRGVYTGFNLEIHFDQKMIVTSRVRKIAVSR
ncbi:MAG TPA: hypothetical protein VGK48_03735 [Terriglobia bacterium]|jgi:hypothetical protein